MCPSVCLSVSQCVLHIVDLTSFHQPYTYRLGVCTRMSCVLHLTFIFVFTPSEIRVKQNFSSNIRRKKNDGRIKTGEMTKNFSHSWNFKHQNTLKIVQASILFEQFRGEYTKQSTLYSSSIFSDKCVLGWNK